MTCLKLKIVTRNTEYLHLYRLSYNPAENLDFGAGSKMLKIGEHAQGEICYY